MPYREDGVASWNMGANVESSASSELRSLRRFGIELEISRAHPFRELQGQTVFGAKGDGSVNGDGREFVSPILQGDDGLQSVRNFLAYANAHNWHADASCGYHLHIDVRDLTGLQKRKIAYAYALTQDVWFAFVNSHRNNSHWCGKFRMTAADVERITEPRGRGFRHVRGHMTRGSWAVCCGTRHGTFEIRLHQGTLVEAEVINWVKLHTWFADYVSRLKWHQIKRRFLNKTAQQQFRIFLENCPHEAALHFYKEHAQRAHGVRLVQAVTA
jgi:hypothetical protein